MAQYMEATRGHRQSYRPDDLRSGNMPLSRALAMVQRLSARLPILLCLAAYATGQQVAIPSVPVPSQPSAQATPQPAASGSGSAPAITLDEAINRARINEPNFVA